MNFGKNYLNLKCPTLTTSQNQTKIHRYQKSDMKLCIYKLAATQYEMRGSPKHKVDSYLCATNI